MEVILYQKYEDYNHHDNSIRKWIHRFNEKGVNGIISKIHKHKAITDIKQGPDGYSYIVSGLKQSKTVKFGAVFRIVPSEKTTTTSTTTKNDDKLDIIKKQQQQTQEEEKIMLFRL
jgi:hypothetical protein